MKYYIDFEASSYWQEIISIGCVDETGRSFYALVRPRKIGKVTKFITNLTGITKEELRQAKKLNEVARDFNTWIDDYRTAEFYCYGDGDLCFVNGELQRPWNEAKQAKKFLTNISNLLVDLSEDIKSHYKLDMPVGLLKVFNHLSAETIQEQDHNALHDAMMLKIVAEKYLTDPIDPNPFQDYILPPEQKGKQVILKDVETGEIFEFSSINKAAQWVQDNVITASPSLNRIRKSIIDAFADDVLYCGFQITVKELSE